MGWVKILRDMNFLKNETRYFSSVKILRDMNFLKNETRYFSSGSNHPDGEVFYRVTLMSKILFIHLGHVLLVEY